MSSNSEKVKQWRENTKRKLVDCCGGKCNRCGYNRCLDCLDFHHINEKEKDFSIGKVMANPRSWDFIIKEVKKCILLCCLCHRELHNGLWNLSEIKIFEFQDLKEPIIPISNCPICGVGVFGKITCSRVCAGKKRSKCLWPLKEKLIELKNQFSRVKIADMLGVSESAIRKYERKLDI